MLRTNNVVSYTYNNFNIIIIMCSYTVYTRYPREFNYYAHAQICARTRESCYFDDPFHWFLMLMLLSVELL